jgi:YidC/Oxa1 family membrane protein insertase
MTTLPLANIIQDIFSPLISVFESVMKFYHDELGLSWGWSIVALTITVRTLLIPLTYKQLKSTLNLQAHAPEMKKIQERYKDDRQKQQEEMMKFYRENKVNPFGSCLPLLAQFPVFISLFYMLRHDLRIDICPDINPPGTANPKPCGSSPESEFLFIPDITNKATGAVLVVLIVLYIGSQLASSWIMSVTADRNQRLLMLALPFVFTIFILNFPAGLIVYWITTNFWTVGQALVMRRMRASHAAELEKKKAEAGELDPGGGLPAGAAAAVDTKTSRSKPKPKADATSDDKAASKGSGDKGASDANGSRASAPPPPPRRKKKRSGRRR